MSDLISREALLDFIEERSGNFGITVANKCNFKEIAKMVKAIDAVEVDALEAWLYEIAMNNTGNYLGDACEEIISRLEGLRVFARERKEVSDEKT